MYQNARLCSVYQPQVDGWIPNTNHHRPPLSSISNASGATFTFYSFWSSAAYHLTVYIYFNLFSSLLCRMTSRLARSDHLLLLFSSRSPNCVTTYIHNFLPASFILSHQYIQRQRMLAVTYVTSSLHSHSLSSATTNPMQERRDHHSHYLLRTFSSTSTKKPSLPFLLDREIENEGNDEFADSPG